MMDQDQKIVSVNLSRALSSCLSTYDDLVLCTQI